MALVPWTYNNPRVDHRKSRSREFIFQGRLVEVVQDLEADIDVTKNTGLKLWDGAFLLARYLENGLTFPAGFWCNKKCVELGSGCGLVGVVTWLLGAKVTLTDMPSAVNHTKVCVTMNTDRLTRGDSLLAGRIADIEVQSYCWGENTDSFLCPFDFVLGSDIVYHPEATESLIASLKLLSGPQTVILITYKPRGLGEDIFFTELTKNGFAFKEISTEHHPHDFQDSGYSIFQIIRSV